MYMAVFKSIVAQISHLIKYVRIAEIGLDFRETRVSPLFSVRRETMMPWRQTPSWKKKAVVFTNVMTIAYQVQLNAGFSKVCEIFKVRGK